VQTIGTIRNILANSLDVLQTIGLYRNILASYLDIV
jgi:hypothetical protein